MHMYSVFCIKNTHGKHIFIYYQKIEKNKYLKVLYIIKYIVIKNGKHIHLQRITQSQRNTQA
jgi:hypothetical protein